MTGAHGFLGSRTTLAHIIELALTRPEAVGQTYNTVDGYTTWRQFTDVFREWLGLGPLPTTQPSAAPVFAWRGRPSGEKPMRELGYVPQHTYEEALAETLALLRAASANMRSTLSPAHL